MNLNLTNGEYRVLFENISAAQRMIKAASPVLGLRLAYAAKQIGSVVETFAEAHKALLEKHAKRDEAGAMIEMPADNGQKQFALEDPAAFFADYMAIAQERFDVTIKAIPVDLLPEKIDADVVAALFPIIEDSAA